MQIHPREQIVNKAGFELGEAWHKVMKEHGLTEAEAMRVVVEFASRWLGGIAKYWIREERHGDPNKPGGMA